MPFHRTRSWVIVIAALLGAAASAKAQMQSGPPPGPGLEPMHDQVLQPFGPIDLGDLREMKLFQPVEFDDLDGYPKGAVGPFLRYERIYWNIHQPSFAFVGSNEPEIVALGLNNNTNQFITADFVWGNRFDIGYRMCDGSGWVTSIVKSNLDFGGFQNVTNVTSVGFFDPTGVLPANALLALVGMDTTGVPFPPDITNDFIPYSNLTIQNSSRFVGVDLMKSIRFEPEHHGGVWELVFGPRFFQFHDRFFAQGNTAIEAFTAPDGLITLPQPPPNIVSIARVMTVPSALNFWDMGIDNNLVGPQLGARWSIERERWTVSADFRALMAANFQNEHLSGATSAGYTTHIIRLDTGATIPGTTTTVGTLGDALFTFNSANHNVTFAPMGEARFDAIYKVTRNVSIEAGYTAILATGISRASDRIIYNVPNMGILNGADHQHVFINGVNFGFNVNY